MVKREDLKNKILNLLKKKNITPSKIVIFGSYAKDDLKQDSDIDIIIVSNDFKNKDLFERVFLMRGMHTELVKIFRRPFDLMYHSEEEWEREYSPVINTAKEEGEVIWG